MAPPGSSLSILTVARTLPWHIRGGMEEVTWKLVQALQDRGHEITILTSALDHEAETYTREGVRVHEIAYVPSWAREWPRYRWWRFFAGAAAEFARERGLEADIVHAQSFYADGFLDEENDPPVAATIHGTAYEYDYLGGSRKKLIEEKGYWHPRRLLQWLDVRYRTYRENRQLDELDLIVPVSPTVESMLDTVPDDDPRVQVIPNGIDPAEFEPIPSREARQAVGIPPEETVVLHLGRIEQSKGLAHLLDVAEEVPEATVHVAGDGPDRDWFHERIEERGLGEEIVLHGRVSDARRNELYAAADLFCLPSPIETFGIVLLEAMLEGTPVTMRGAWIPEDLLAFSVVDGDPVEGVRRGLELADKLDAAEIRETVAENYAWDKIAEQYEAAFHRTLAGDLG